jgi:hypothetical protein
VAAPADLVGDAELLERGHGVRRERDSRSDGLERGGALADDGLVPAAGQRDRGRETADPAADHEDSHSRHRLRCRLQDVQASPARPSETTGRRVGIPPIRL